MGVPRQEGSHESGRVNQKRRTRAALVDAAKLLLQQGVTPTVPQVAEAALVSRTTAYRYFPTQESLLLELALTVDVDDIESLVQAPLEGDGDGAVARTVEVVRTLNRHVLAEEVRYRNALRLYLDQWLESTAAGEEEPIVREGRRVRWFTDCLAPLGERLPGPELDRLVAALSLVAGVEGITALRDVCRLDAAAALDVTEWAARALLDAALGNQHRP